MDKKSEDKMREKFIETLYKLAHFDGRGPEDIDEDEMWPKIYKMFDELYGNTSLEGEEFRHYYSDIFIVISNINNEIYGGDILNITSKIERLFEYIDKHKQEDRFKDTVINKIKKLYDHLTLEKSRIDYTYSLVRLENNFSINSFRDEISSAQDKLKSNEKQINEVKTNIDTLERRTQNYQKEYIAILSIFSAVVLAFIGGITFSVSVLQNVHEWDLLMGLSVVSLIGLVLSNILFLLFNFISNIINNKNKFIRDKYYISFNIIMLIILIVSLIKHFMV